LGRRVPVLASRHEDLAPHLSKPLWRLVRWLKAQDPEASLYSVGGHARGDCLDDSDLDLVTASKLFARLHLGARFSLVKAHMDPGYSLDLLAYTPGEFKRAVARSSIRQDMLKNSIRLV